MTAPQFIDVLLVSGANDPHCSAIQAALASVAESERFNLSDLPAVRFRAGANHLELDLAGRTIAVDGRTTVWWHRSGRPLTASYDPQEAQLVLDEAPHLLRGALAAVGVRFVDDPWTVERAEHKLWQLAVVRRLGIKVPDTAVTNDPNESTALLAAHRLVAKPVSPGVGIAPFVVEVDADDADLVRGLPVMLQSLVHRAKADLRIVTVGAQSWVWRRPRDRGTVDWRQMDPSGAGFETVVEPDVAQQAVRVTHALGLTMSVQDWLEVDDGPVFLEANPQGAWHFLDGAVDRVAPAFAKHLVPVPPGTDGKWPSPLRRLRADFMRASRAPANDGATAPQFAVETLAHAVSSEEGALDIARRANDEAKAGAQAAEDKAHRLLQTALALLAIALGVAGFQMRLASDQNAWWWAATPSAVLAAVCLAIAAFEATQVDRVGFYEQATLDALSGTSAMAPNVAVIAAEERGRRLARWSSQRKHSDLMQARAWFSRGLAALAVAGLLGAIGYGVAGAGTEASPSKSTPTSSP